MIVSFVNKKIETKISLFFNSVLYLFSDFLLNKNLQLFTEVFFCIKQLNEFLVPYNNINDHFHEFSLNFQKTFFYIKQW